MRYFKNSWRGFTLIELLVSVTIIAVLSAVGMVIFSGAGKSSRNAKRKADLESIRQALVLYRADNACYPETLNMTTGDPLTSAGSSYISLPFPRDPQSPKQEYQYDAGSATSVTCAGGGLGKAGFTLSAQLENKDGLTPTPYVLTNP